MSKKIKFLLCETYSRPSLVEIIQHIDNIPNLKGRERHIGEYRTRLETIEKTTVEFFKYGKPETRDAYLLDFCKRYDLGPGRAFNDSRVESFPFDNPSKTEKGSYGSLTAVLYEPKSRFAVVQYNHTGSRFSSIAEYLSQIFPDIQEDVQFKVAINEEIAEKLEAMENEKTIEFAYLPENLTVEMRERLGVYSSLDSIEKVLPGIAKVQFKLTAKPSKGRLDGGKELAKKVRELIKSTNDEEVVKVAKIRGVNTSGQVEEIDLISEKISEEYDAPSAEDGLYKLESRSALLKTAFTRFSAQGRLITTLGNE